MLQEPGMTPKKKTWKCIKKILKMKPWYFKSVNHFFFCQNMIITKFSVREISAGSAQSKSVWHFLAYDRQINCNIGIRRRKKSWCSVLLFQRIHPFRDCISKIFTKRCLHSQGTKMLFTGLGRSVLDLFIHVSPR